MDGKQIADNYIEVNHICREERQYALFLYMIFLKAKKNLKLTDSETAVIRACLDIDEKKAFEIKHVFYEATLMRDFFENDRQTKDNKDKRNNYHPEYSRKCSYKSSDIPSFNEKLLTELFLENKKYEFVYAKNEIDENKIKDIFSKIPRFYNLKNLTGFDSKSIHFVHHNTAEDLIDVDDSSYSVLLEAHNMMNAKPDIMVIYEQKDNNENKTYYKCLECKYTSDEKKNKNYQQTNTQRNILRFLFNSDNINAEIIRFVDMCDEDKLCKKVYDDKNLLVETEISLSILIDQYCK